MSTAKEPSVNGVRNAERCTDSTSNKTITLKDIEKKSYEIGKIMRTIFCICELAGYDIKGRITFTDRKTGWYDSLTIDKKGV